MNTPQAIPKGAKVKMQSSAPGRKVALAGIGGAITTILIFTFNTYILPVDKPLTPEVAAAITTVVTFIVGYRARPSANDQVVEDLDT